MVEGTFPEKVPAKPGETYSISFEDAVGQKPLVERTGDTQQNRPWMARPGIAPGFAPAQNAPAGENVFTPSLERMQKPQQPVIPPTAFAPPFQIDAQPSRPKPQFAAPENPDTNTSQPGGRTSPFASPFTQPTPFNPGRPGDTRPQPAPLSPTKPGDAPPQPAAINVPKPGDIPKQPTAINPPKPGDTPSQPAATNPPKPGDIPKQPAPSYLPPPRPNEAVAPPADGRGRFGGNLDQTVPWTQWINQGQAGVGVPGLGGKPTGFPAVGGPQLGAPPAGADRPGINPSPQALNISPEARKAIDDALHNAVPVESHLIAGGTWGAALNTTKWALDTAYARGNVQWWGPYSPMMKTIGKEQLRVEAAQEVHAAATAGREAAAGALTPASANIKTLIEGLDHKLHASIVANPAVEILGKQHEFLKDANNLLDPARVQATLGTSAEVAAGTKLFESGSIEAKQLIDFANHAAGVVPAADAQALLNARQTLLSGIESQLTAHTAGGGAAASTLGEDALNLLNNQRNFLTNVENLANVKKVQAAIGTAEQVAAGEKVGSATKLFVAGSPEAKALMERAEMHVKFYQSRATATAAENQLNRLETEMQALKDAGSGNGFAAAAKGFAVGALITGGTIGAGYLADKYLLGHSPQMNGFDRFLVDGVAIPGVLLTPGIPARYKVGTAIGLFGLARAKAYFDDAGVPALSQSSLLLRPNTVDTLGFTAAALAPLGVRGKLAIAGVTLVGGRVYNAVAHAAGWDGEDGIELRERLNNRLATDATTKSNLSFTNAVDSGLALSKHKAGEGALDLQMADLINSQRGMNPLDYLRQHAILAEAIGMARLEKGSRIVEGGNNAVDVYGDSSRILKDKHYDFLGESMLSLSQAYTDLSDLRYAIFQEKAKVTTDKTMNAETKRAQLEVLDGQMKQCDAERIKIDTTLKGVFGAHDMESIFKELNEACRTRSTDMDKILFKRKQLFETLSTQVNPEMRAKFARDLAVGFMAEAQYRITKNNGEEANIMYQSAMDYLGKAQALTPNNPNNPKLQLIATKLSTEIPRATNTQYNSNFNNPFELKPPSQLLTPPIRK